MKKILLIIAALGIASISSAQKNKIEFSEFDLDIKILKENLIIFYSLNIVDFFHSSLMSSCFKICL